jgi:hypothetical protein
MPPFSRAGSPSFATTEPARRDATPSGLDPRLLRVLAAMAKRVLEAEENGQNPSQASGTLVKRTKVR